MNAIDASFYSKNFNVSRYMLRYIVGASTDELRQDQLDRIVSYREIADREIGGVIEDNYINFNSSLAMFTTISNQNRGFARVILSQQTQHADVIVFHRNIGKAR